MKSHAMHAYMVDAAYRKQPSTTVGEAADTIK